MEIKKTRILHRRYTAQEWATKRLKQGEIGILLSDDKSEILQVRVGMTNGVDGDGGLFSEGVLLGVTESNVEAVRQFQRRQNFPSIGSEFICYMSKEDNSIWRWDDGLVNYVLCSSSVLPGQGNGWWQELNGGGASLYNNEGNLNLGTSTKRDWSLPNNINIKQ